MEIICPKCSKVRKYPPCIVTRLTTHECRQCTDGSKPKLVVCPECGKVRTFRPATIARLKTATCKECIDKASRAAWVVIRCPHCGNERSLPPAEAERRMSDSCLRCPRHVPGVIPETFDAGYVLGTIMGDGSLRRLKQKGGFISYVVGLSVTSRVFAERFRAHLATCTGKKPWMTSHTSLKKANPKIGMKAKQVTEWIVGLTNRDWYDRLKPYKKDRIFTDLPTRSEGFRHGFIQGMLDSEGYIPEDRKYLDIAGGDIGLLEAVAKVFRSLGEKAKVYGPYSYSRGVAHLRAKAGAWVKTKG